MYLFSLHRKRNEGSFSILPFPPFGGNGSIAWTSAVPHVGRTANAFKDTMKPQTFLFQMVVTSCISVQYLWKYGFANSSDNLYALCILASWFDYDAWDQLFLRDYKRNCISLTSSPEDGSTCSAYW